MKFKCISKWDQLPQNSRSLFSQAEKDSLFFSDHWFKNLLATTLKKKQSLVLACVIEKNKSKHDQLLAILPLIKCANNEWISLHHIMLSSLYTLLVVKTNQQAIIDCMAKGIAQLSPKTLTLEPCAEDDSNINRLKQALELTGMSCNSYLRFFNWSYPLRGQTFNEYLATRPSKLRNTIVRKQRKLEREHSYEIRLYTGNKVTSAMEDYYRVFKASWKPQEIYKETINDLTEAFTKKDWTRLAILYIDKQPVATQLWFVVHKKANIFKLAYDESWKQYSPGSILSQYLMEYAINKDKVEIIDFLTGNEPYKQDWMSQRKRRWKLIFTQGNKTKKLDNPFIKAIRKKWLANFSNKYNRYHPMWRATMIREPFHPSLLYDLNLKTYKYSHHKQNEQKKLKKRQIK